MHPRSAILCLLGLTLGSALLAQPRAARWAVTKTAELSQFSVPECVLPTKSMERKLFVSNIEAEKDQYWTDDGTGFISVIAKDKMKRLRWLRSAPGAKLDGPKGMCILDDKLYFTDNTRLMCCNVKDGKGLKVVATGFVNANDLATDGDGIWVSDSKEGKIWRVAPDGAKREIPSPPSVNGLTFAKEKMYAVSWDLHEVYEVFPLGDQIPRPFGLAEHFTNLDGIEVLQDGSFIVSDFKGNKVSAITPDKKTVYTLVEIDSPADIGIDRNTMTLYVPQFFKDKVAIFKLHRASGR